MAHGTFRFVGVGSTLRGSNLGKCEGEKEAKQGNSLQPFHGHCFLSPVSERLPGAEAAAMTVTMYSSEPLIHQYNLEGSRPSGLDAASSIHETQRTAVSHGCEKPLYTV